MEEIVYFDLATERVVVLTDRNRTYTLYCRPITDADWQQYFAGIVITAEQEGKTRINTIDVLTPRLALAERVLTSAQGYRVAGGAELASIPDWWKKIPLSHRQKLGETLADVRPSRTEDDDLVIYPEGEVVLLDATFSAYQFEDDEGNTRQAMRKIVGLKHVFSTPSEEQHRRYTRESSRSKVVGGSRTGKTIYQGSQPLLAKLYDELVISVEGYSLGAVPLTDDRNAIVREMDMLHKVIAAQELFQPQDTSVLAGGDEE
jgi:hypothetical protein